MIFFNWPIRATVIFPTYGAAPFSLWSLKSVCRQTIKNIEIFVVCDGSPPDMVSMFKDFQGKDKRVKVFEFPKSERTGEPHRDFLIKKKARGKNIFYCSHDDLWLPDHIQNIEKLLRKKAFVHSIHALVNEFDEHTTEEQIFKTIIYADISNVSFRNRMLNDECLENFFGLTYTAHSRKSYLKLKEGWTTTPPGIWTDLYMWRKFLVEYGDACGTYNKITALNFPAYSRADWALEKREEELEYFFNKIQDSGFIARIREMMGTDTLIGK